MGTANTDDATHVLIVNHDPILWLGHVKVITEIASATSLLNKQPMLMVNNRIT